jgi:hypothetical protein
MSPHSFEQGIGEGHHVRMGGLIVWFVRFEPRLLVVGLQLGEEGEGRLRDDDR